MSEKFIRTSEGQRILNIVGLTFGGLTAIEFKRVEKSGAIFNFECECGRQTELSGTLVKTGRQTHCGCKRGTHNKGRRYNELGLSRVGEKHGLITIIDTEWSQSRGYQMICSCSCGSSKRIKCVYPELLNGKVKSCGCHQKNLVSVTGSTIGLNNNQKSGKMQWCYKDIFMRSGLEVLFALYLDNTKQIWEYEPEIFLLQNGMRYRPDFYLPALDKWIEIKGYFKSKDFEKHELFKATGRKLEVYQIKAIEELSGLCYQDLLRSGKYRCVGYG